MTELLYVTLQFFGYSLYLLLVHGNSGEDDTALSPKCIAEHLPEYLEHGYQRPVHARRLAVDGDDEEVNLVAFVHELVDQLGNDLGVGVIVGVIESDGVNQ